MVVRRALVCAAMAAVALFGVLPATSAQATESCGVILSCVTTYYSNNTYTVVVGHRYVSCEGFVTYDGTVTVYRKVVSEPCE
jgi:uncharacterized protein DUF6289